MSETKTNIKLKAKIFGIVDPQGRSLFIMALGALRRQPMGKDAAMLARAAVVIDAEFRAYDDGFRSVVKKYGKEVNGNYSITPDNENFKDAMKEIEELQAHEFEIPMTRKIRLPDDLPVTAESLTANDYLQLQDLLELE